MRLLGQMIVAVNVSDAVLLEHGISFQHFTDSPLQRAGSLLRLTYNGNQKMRNAVVHIKFNRLRVNKYHSHVIRRILVQQTDQH